MKLVINISLSLWAFVCAGVSGATGERSSLYYSLASDFDAVPRHWETRFLGGYVFSDPYAHLLALRLEQFYAFDRTFALGVGGETDQSLARSSAEILKKDLGPYGFEMTTLTPSKRAYLVGRLSPLTGLLNFFSSRVVPLDIGLLIRAGVTRFSNGPDLGVYLGTGMEARFFLSSTWAFQVSLNWEVDKPSQRPWQSQVGFMVGPSASF